MKQPHFEALRAETDRCIIRALTPGDYPAFLAGYGACMEPQNRFDEGRVDPDELPLDWYLRLLQRRQDEADRDYCYMFHVFEKAGHAIGFCNIRTIYREEIQCGEIGYTVFNNHWGKGYGTEIVTALTELGFGPLGFHRLEACVNLDNPASKAVLRKSGYGFECIREKYLLEDGVWTDNEIYCRINTQE